MSDKQGASSYYSSNLLKEEAEKITNIIEKNGVSPLNTRIIKK